MTPPASPRTDSAALAAFLLDLGGRLWRERGARRIHLPAAVAAEFVGLRVRRHPSGHVAAATLHGRPLGRTEACNMLHDLCGFCYDETRGRFVGSCYGAAETARARFAAVARLAADPGLVRRVEALRDQAYAADDPACAKTCEHALANGLALDLDRMRCARLLLFWVDPRSVNGQPG